MKSKGRWPVVPQKMHANSGPWTCTPCTPYTSTVGVESDVHCRAGRKLLCRGGMARKPICPTPPSPSLVAVPGGGFGLGLPYLPCRGGGGSDPNIHGSK